MSFKQELIPNEDFVFRRVLPHERTGPKKRRFPNETHFELRPNEKGLSVNWDKYLDVKGNFILIGLTQNLSTGKFQNHTAYKLFKFPVILFRDMENIEDVIHTPIYNGNPAPVGQPNNQAHSEVIYENDIEIFVKLSDYSNQEYENSFCEFNVNSINDEIEELRALLNNTQFHKV